MLSSWNALRPSLHIQIFKLLLGRSALFARAALDIDDRGLGELGILDDAVLVRQEFFDLLDLAEELQVGLDLLVDFLELRTQLIALLQDPGSRKLIGQK